MKFNRFAAVFATVSAAALPALAMASTGSAAPEYTIQDLGVVAPFQYSQAFGISTSGNYVVGRSLFLDPNTTGSYWPTSVYSTSSSSMQGMPGLAGHPYDWGYGINNAGVAVGISAVGTSGNGALPTMWSNGTTTQLNLPVGQTIGHAMAINNNGIAVGSVGYDVSEVGAIYNTVSGNTLTISALSSDGSYVQRATAISDNGIIVGAGVSAGNTSDALVYNMNTNTMVTLATPAANANIGSIAFGISANGQYVVGSTGYDSFLWSASTGVLIGQMPANSSSASLSGVNDSGWAVGTAGGLYSNPFLFENGSSYLMNDIITNGAGWNFTTTTSASAMGIADNGSIVGTAQYDGVEHMYLATLVSAVPEPASCALMVAAC